jgi:hypothetical protein
VSAVGDEKKGWVAGRVKETADGLSGRPRTPQDDQRLREAAAREQRRAQENRHRMREGGDDRDR